MAYATQQNLIDRFSEAELIQLTDRTGSNVIDPVVVARALADADAQIDGYLAVRYALPLASVPGVLEKLACDIARYQLYDDRVTETVKTRFEQAIKFLQDVASEKATLGLSANNGPAANGNTVEMSSTTPVFRRSESGGFI